MSQCEVRIPTYKRPELLKRALESLRSQTHENWIGIVMDDSPLQEGREVVNYYHDPRIIYSPNQTNLGRCGNLDRAFQSKSYYGGDYAFVLEDDNYLFPNFIAANIKSINVNHVSIVLRNQEFRIEKNGESLSTGKTTRGDWFENKIYQPIEMYAYLFFHTGISNGGLFWDTKTITSNLQVGTEIKHSSWQEMFRCLQITDNIYFESEPLCAFTYFESRDDIQKTSQHENRLWSRGCQSLYMFLIKKYGEKIVKLATDIAAPNYLRKSFTKELESLLIDALYLKYDYQLYQFGHLLKIFVKSLMRYILYPDPFSKYYSQTFLKNPK